MQCDYDNLSWNAEAERNEAAKPRADVDGTGILIVHAAPLGVFKGYRRPSEQFELHGMGMAAECQSRVRMR